MYSIKRENEDIICRGCLSSDRRLAPLTNYDLYFTLIGSKESLEEYKYMSIRLCWECLALLRRTQVFRQRLQHAQYTLSLAHDKQISTSTLSTLNYNHKQDYDCTIDETIESKPIIEQLVIQEGIDIKEEFDADNYIETDYYETENHNESSNEKKKKREIKKGKNESNRKYRITGYEKVKLEKIDNTIDFNDPGKYFSQTCLSEREVEELLERDRDDGDETNRPHKCASCGFRFASRSELHAHRRDYHRERITIGQCPCGYEYSTHWDFELHSWRSHEVYRCVLCGRAVARDRDRARHLEQHRFRYRCVKCMFDFNNKHHLAYHQKQLHLRYLCDLCGHSSKAKKALEKHIQRKHLPNKCPECPKTFDNFARMSRHLKSRHARPGDECYCVECDATFDNRGKYQRHLSQSRRHRPRKKISIPCPECGKLFSRKNYLNNHVKLFHSNQSRHHCQLCDKYFVTAFSLRSHNKYVHEKIPMPKTKICNVCGRGFGTNRVLENHMRTHTGERPFACEHCSAAFAQRVALKAHRAAIHKEK